MPAPNTPRSSSSSSALAVTEPLDRRHRSTWAAVRNESTQKGRRIGSADAWIAVTALVLWAPLVTNNPKDYRHLDKLQIVSAAAE